TVDGRELVGSLHDGRELRVPAAHPSRPLRIGVHRRVRHLALQLVVFTHQFADSVGMPLSHLRLSWLRVACCPEDRCWPAMTCTRKAAPAGQELTARAPPASLAGPLAVPRLEPRHTAAGVQDLLLAGVE